MKLFVTGVNGQLGYDVLKEAKKRGFECVGSDITPVYSGIADKKALDNVEYVAMDITNTEQVEKVLDAIRPDSFIHCAAWTNVDGAEDPDNLQKVFAINRDGTHHIARSCARIGCKLMYISTDYVFDGQGTLPWQPDCKDFSPLNIYGESKLAGENAVIEALDQFFIVRIAWVFGFNGNNFVKTMLNLAKTHRVLRVVDDQIGTPTYTYDLARLLVDMIGTDKYGYYHVTNEGGYISWFDFAVEIFKQAGIDIEVIPVTTFDYGMAKAVRPFNSRLDKRKLIEKGFVPLPIWQDALARYLKEISR